MEIVLIGGCGRSGTTLLGSILGSSDSVITTPESDFIYRYYNRDLRKNSKSSSTKLSYGDFLKRDWRFKQWKLNIPEEINTSYPRSLKELGDCNLKLVEAFSKKRSKSRFQTWIDHSPANIREYYLNLRMYEKVNFIHIVRDPRAIYLSVKKLDWGPNTSLKTAEWWKDNIAAGLALETKYPERVKVVRYEDLLSNPHKVLKNISGFCGIEYKEKMLEGDGLQLPEYTQKQHSLIGEGIDPTRAYSWKKKIRRRDVKIIEASTRSLLHRFDYEYLFDYATNQSKVEIMKQNMWEIFKFFPNRIKKKIRERIES